VAYTRAALPTAVTEEMNMGVGDIQRMAHERNESPQ
jgi:hypothetical protein